MNENGVDRKEKAPVSQAPAWKTGATCRRTLLGAAMSAATLHGEVAAHERAYGLLVVHGGDGLGELTGDGDGLDLAAFLNGDGVGDQALDDRPVSYTHLDVYKRQGCIPGSPTT